VRFPSSGQHVMRGGPVAIVATGGRSPLRPAGTPRRHRVEMVMDLLRGRWASGQQIVEHVKGLSAQAGDQTAYNSSPGAARNARALAKSRGLAWWVMDVNRDETGPAPPGNNGHRLYAVMRRNEAPPHHRAMDAGAEPVGDQPLVAVSQELISRSAAEIAKRRDANERDGGGTVTPNAGSGIGGSVTHEVNDNRGKTGRSSPQLPLEGVW